jgi:hypothetical protein
MKLSVLERITLLGVLPEQGDFVTLKIVRKLRESLAFDEVEIAALKIQQTDGRIMWDASADTNKDVLIGEKATDIVCECLQKLDKEKKLEERHYSLYEQFVMKEKDNE